MVSTHMNLYWDNNVWVVIEKTVLKYPDKYKPGFLAWLHERPALWDKLASVAHESLKLDDPYGFSILSLVHIIEVESSEDDPQYVQNIDYTFVRELGCLLLEVVPEVADCLWKGERYQYQKLKELTLSAQEIEESDPKLKGFFLVGEDDPYNSPEFMLFPELKNLATRDLSEQDDICH